VALALVAAVSALAALGAVPGEARAQNLTVDGNTVQMGGVHYYGQVQIINGGVIEVIPYDGSDKVNTGNLQIVADSIYIDAISGITADGAGYQPVFCGDGAGPTALAGGRGGCAVRDSGGGGAHFGRGGRGTIDNPPGFPAGYEEDCGDLNAAQDGCVNTCTQNGDGLPTVAGQPYSHSIYEPEFGAAGGDRGCRDGDGFSNPCLTAGAGGGRVVLAAVSSGGTGTLVIEGRVSAEGWRGCGNGNDSGGGGAGGTVLLVGDSVTTAAGAYISAKGGLGGDTLGTPPDPADPFGQACPACAQSGGTCDDCGGGGGGGIVSVLSGVPAQLDPLTQFDVAGAVGGTCTGGNCIGESGGGAGELQLNGVYLGEYCDGYDNDFDGLVDNGLGDVTCGSGACQVTVPVCDTGASPTVPNDCVPVADPQCQAAVSDTRPRFLVIVDTSGSMLLDLDGHFTFGDGSAGHLGVDSDGDSVAGNDSRLYQAKQALTNVISAYVPEIDFALARFSQGTQANVNCQLAHWFECAGICCTYDNPVGNTGTTPGGPCYVSAGAAGSLEVLPQSTGDECINYAGSCGAVRRGADILVGFERPVNQALMWLDHQETNFQNVRTEGDHCDWAGGGDCELRGTGPTPLADSLYSAKAYLARTLAEDIIAGCRGYSVILLTDGTETCGGDPQAAAAELLGDLGVQTYVIGFSVLPGEQAALDQIANAGSTGGTRDAFFAGNEAELAAALASIVADSVVFETCNGVDDDCDTLVDEDFPSLGQPCDNGLLGPCFGTGTYQCRADETGVECVISPPAGTPSAEVCNGIDDNCNGQVDEGLTCQTPCVPDPPEVCNGLDDDCDGAVDEEDPLLGLACGEDEGQCEPGQWICAVGELVCVGATGAASEMCNGLDDDCDGVIDDDAECPPDTWCIEGGCREECLQGEFPCPGGYECESYDVDGDTVRVCMPGACLECEPGEVCQDGQCVDPCEDVSCGEGEDCVLGVCQDCHVLGCPEGEICYDGQCRVDPCAEAGCDPATAYCDDGQCVPLCYEGSCPAGQRCGPDGRCVPDPCHEVDCPSGEICVDGTCEADVCGLVYCEPGSVCVPPGECVPDPCPLLDCPAGARCVVEPDGAGRCAPEAERPPGEPILRLTTGGGGCGCQAGAGSGAGLGGGGGGGVAGAGAGAGDAGLPLALGAWGLLLALRRRRRRRIASGGRIASGRRLSGASRLSPEPRLSQGRRPSGWRRALVVALAAGGLGLGLGGLGGLAGLAGGCRVHTYDIYGDGGVSGDASPVSGDASGLEPDSGPLCIPPGTEEVCNERDDDCDGVVDNGFDKQNDPENCGTCGNICAAPHANVVCVEGQCELVSCQIGFADLDPAAPGCEYACPVYPPQPEDCNGVDEDCDGDIDEAAELPAPPQGLCRDQAGTPCAGVSMICATRGNPPVTAWYCDYPPSVEFDPLVPNGIALEETLCDGADGDCDGAVDEVFGDLGLECDNGGVGACRDVGVRACDPVDATATYCDLSVLPDPDPLAPRAEQCNGADDDCDGVVDNFDPADPARVLDDMVHVQHSGLDFWIYRYEASRPDASASSAGSSDARPCSRDGVLPWANLTHDAAAAACAQVGKRLCTAAEWAAACAGATGYRYPYGDTYQADTCNGVDHDGVPGGADDDVLLPAGDRAQCLSEDGVADLSGNLREWTDPQTGTTSGGDPVYGVRGGEYQTPAPGLACDFTTAQAVGTVVLPTVGFRCCSDTAP
jgi:hypothetical protein